LQSYPKKWFSQYGNLLGFTEGDNELVIENFSVGLVHDFANMSWLPLPWIEKLQRLSAF
jgi:hypothetical protein